jgi:Zn-dependent metalloprotease
MLGVNEDYTRVLDPIRSIDDRVIIRTDPTRAVVTSVRGALGAPAPGDSPDSTVHSFLGTYGDAFGPTPLLDWLKPLPTVRDHQGWTKVEFQQIVKSAPSGEVFDVYGAKVFGHVNADGGLIEIQSSCWRTVPPPTKPRITASALQRSLTARARNAPGFAKLERSLRKQNARSFPVMQPARLVVYPWRGQFLLAWTTYAYQPAISHRAGEDGLQLTQVFVDAMTGEPFTSSPTAMHATAPAFGVGGGTVRNVNVTSAGKGNHFLLRDTTHTRDIITYDLKGKSQWTSTPEIGMAMVADALSVARITTTATGNPTAPPPSRIASQQPGVDAHFFCAEVYEWYDTLSGGRQGWDDGQYPGSVAANQPVRIATHVNPCTLVNAKFDAYVNGTQWTPFLMFWDANLDLTCDPQHAGDRAFDYMAGSRQIVAHEYQHAITMFSVRDGAEPAHWYEGWGAAVHEGLSDVFGCLYSDTWAWGPEISPTGLVIRNAAYPRDPKSWGNQPGLFPCSTGNNHLDHFDDRNLFHDQYDRGTILAHCAYLMGPGGIHERGGRTPVLIPVPGLGREVINGKSVYKAARIWYRALTTYFAAKVSRTGDPSKDEKMFPAFRDICVNSAGDLYGEGSIEQQTTALAFYAVGLQPDETSYGPDVTAVRAAQDWIGSQPHLGGLYGDAPLEKSLDLFINNGGRPSGWTAKVNVLGTGGPPPAVENTVYCRVRSVGDQAAANVQVDFFYAKAEAEPPVWMPVVDKGGAPQSLVIGTLAPGVLTFPDTRADQDNPPAGAGVEWAIPALSQAEADNGLLLKAVVSSGAGPHRLAHEVVSKIECE